MERICTNCNNPILNDNLTPKLATILEKFYGEIWDREIEDIAMEICPICGTLPELITYVENQIQKGRSNNYKNVIKEFDDNLHVPFLLQVAAPIMMFIIENSTPTLQKAAIDELGNYGDEDSVGRFILAHQNDEVRILGLRALEKIAKHEGKKGRKLNWKEYIDYIVVDDILILQKMKKKLKTKNFLKISTINEIKPILESKELILLKK